MRSAFSLSTRGETAMLLPYLAESALTFVPESEPGGEVYRLVRHVLDALETGVDATLAARYFEVLLLFFAGLLPQDESCALPPKVRSRCFSSCCCSSSADLEGDVVTEDPRWFDVLTPTDGRAESSPAIGPPRKESGYDSHGFREGYPSRKQRCDK
ncbi:MAG: DNA repair protein RecO C-terminal domain-containing protein [Thermoanaerobaculia bacterium]